MNVERQSITCLLEHPKLLPSYRIGAEHFSGIKEAIVFSTICKLIKEGKEPDAILVTETLNFETGKEWLKDVVEILAAPCSRSNAAAYEEQILKSYRRRKLTQAAGEFHQMAKDGDENAVTRLMAEIRELEREEKTEIRSIDDLLPSVIDEVDRIHCGEGGGILTGITKLDELTGGLQPTDLTIIAARTSVGKTAFMLNVCANVDVPCGIISGEQSGSQIIQRLIAKTGDLSAYRMRAGRLDADDMARFVDAGLALKNRPLYIVDKARPSIDQVERWARQMQWEHDIKVVFIDYLQLLKNNAYADKRLQIDDISKRLKGLALELEIPVVCLAQLNRNAAAESRVPRLSDLKESGAIEEDADQVILLYRHENTPSQLTVDVQKQRNGSQGFFEVGWNKDSMRVSNEY